MKTMLLFILLLAAGSVAFPQTRDYELQGIGMISIPDDLELQSQNYISNATGMPVSQASSSRFVFQQSGLNDGEANAFDKYVRVIIAKGMNSTKAEPLPLNYNATAEEMKTLNTMLKSGLSDDLAPGNVLLGWGGAQLVNSEVNYQSAIESSYLRRYQTNLPVVVFTYLLFDDDYVYVIMLSCREQALKYWRPRFQKIFESFKIINDG